ncbi:MAG TPA: penicillin acylase family protein, partial [Thermoanaerobaculia bacterium]
AYITTHPLPPEYAYLEINSVPPWTPADSLVVAKLIAFGLSFDLDLDATVAFLSYQGAGRALGFDGAKFFQSDTWRVQPFSNAATIPDATSAGGTLPLKSDDQPAFGGEGAAIPNADVLLKLAREYRQTVAEIPALAGAIDPERHAGSNEWAVAGRNTTTGNAMLANDPHLSLGIPPNFYPVSLRGGGYNVAGMGFPGAPFVIQGQNERITWGSTVHPMDVTDLYQEQLVPDPASPSGFSSMYKGAREQVVPIPVTFRVNNLANGVQNDSTVVPASASVPAAVLVVPRHGPIISVDAATGVAITVQYAGAYPTFELESFMRINRASNVEEFRNALQYFDVGSQNFAYADVDGNIAYFTSGELPLREDLQAGRVEGVPPYFIRNGQGGNEWMALTGTRAATQALPYAILPYAEMPQVVNPSNGWFVNANNDPIGQTLDNNPLNTPRAGGGILYLSPGYDGIRAGRITQLMRARLANGGKVSAEDMKAFQADVMLYDAQIFVPFITRALQNSRVNGAHNTLAALGNVPAVSAAVGRLAAWNYLAPTGIPTGYDASDVDGVLGTPTQAEVDASIAATIYTLWRSMFLASTIDGVLRAMTMPLPPAQQALASMRWHLENFQTRGGRGESGVNFFNVQGVSDPAAARDVVILNSLSQALQLAASDAFAPAFNRSTDPANYQWGKLHRIVFSHLTGFATFSPGAPFGPAPFPSVTGLPGVAVDGGFSVVDASSHNPRATTVNGFMFSSGPNRRYVGELTADGVRGQSSLPGGVSGNYASPLYTNLLMLWLTNDTFPVVNDAAPRVPWLR